VNYFGIPAAKFDMIAFARIFSAAFMEAGAGDTCRAVFCWSTKTPCLQRRTALSVMPRRCHMWFPAAWFTMSLGGSDYHAVTGALPPDITWRATKHRLEHGLVVILTSSNQCMKLDALDNTI